MADTAEKRLNQLEWRRCTILVNRYCANISYQPFHRFRFLVGMFLFLFIHLDNCLWDDRKNHYNETAKGSPNNMDFKVCCKKSTDYGNQYKPQPV